MAASKPRESRLRIGRSKTGLGLFATDVINKGEFVIEYIGQRISNAEVAERTDARYLFEVNTRWTIDGSPRWNKARYINHSCRPNCEVVITRGQIRIFALKRIRPDDEITYNYGKDYFNTFIRPKGCRCSKCEPAA
ncbi:SET domain-containing protein [Microvirga brassicacearum]|uniref:SET domain-containing protein n=1 Tax=Microvirga brassicacearum TaxID=2580413 RepID=A0A5N3P7L7_9HYPH|nr:SET domain-containing protein [Microvirga brassicacearum]KAB0265738.1 SET domain-containing protein [Microvirga brassicacearum]